MKTPGLIVFGCFSALAGFVIGSTAGADVGWENGYEAAKESDETVADKLEDLGIDDWCREMRQKYWGYSL